MSQLRAEAALVIVEPERLRAPASAYAQAWEAKIMSGSCVVVGIDVAKLGDERLAHDAEGHTALQPAGAPLVVMKATGGCEATLACAAVRGH